MRNATGKGNTLGSQGVCAINLINTENNEKCHQSMLDAMEACAQCAVNPVNTNSINKSTGTWVLCVTNWHKEIQNKIRNTSRQWGKSVSPILSTCIRHYRNCDTLNWENGEGSSHGMMQIMWGHTQTQTHTQTGPTTSKTLNPVPKSHDQHSDSDQQSDQLLLETSTIDQWNHTICDFIGLLHWFPVRLINQWIKALIQQQKKRKKSTGGEWIVGHSPKILKREEKATTIITATQSSMEHDDNEEEYNWPCDAPVCGHDEDGSHVRFQGSIQEREALNVQHVNLVNEQHLQPCKISTIIVSWLNMLPKFHL